MPEEIALELIRRDGGTQSRAFMNDQTIQEYREALADGVMLPPAKVFFDGENYWLTDGFHRCEAALREGWKTYPCEVVQGSLRDAILDSVSANATHGLKRNEADKHRAVNKLLSDDEWKQWSDREIGRRCHVDHKTVAKLRPEKKLNGDFPIEKRKFVSKHGTIAERKVKPKIPVREKPEPIELPAPEPEPEEWEQDDEPIEEPEFEDEGLEAVLYEMRHFEGWDNKKARNELIERFNAAYDAKELEDE
jgi:hypothetical protein